MNLGIDQNFANLQSRSFWSLHVIFSPSFQLMTPAKCPLYRKADISVKNRAFEQAYHSQLNMKPAHGGLYRGFYTKYSKFNNLWSE
jgi:hypothetical protein